MSRLTTRQPGLPAKKWWMKLEPMNPAPPVTSTEAGVKVSDMSPPCYECARDASTPAQLPATASVQQSWEPICAPPFELVEYPPQPACAGKLLAKVDYP